MATFEELVLEATENSTKQLLSQILDEIKKASEIKTGEIASNIDLLLESWDESVSNNPDQADFCIELAKLNPNDTILIRSVLGNAIKSKLPPLLSKPGFIRSMGIRDSNISLQDIIFRFNNLLKLRTGIYVFQQATGTWYAISDIDEFSATVVISGLSSIFSTSQPVSVCISKSRFFKSTPKLRKLVTTVKRNVIPVANFRDTLNKSALAPISNKAIDKIAQVFYIPKAMDKSQFASWLEGKTEEVVEKSKIQERSPASSRSIKEMHQLLTEVGTDYIIDEQEAAKYANFFSNVKEELIAREPKLFIDTICMINPKAEYIKEVFSSIADKSIFWPQNFQDVNIDTFSVWTKIPVKKLDIFANVTKVLFGTEYLGELCLFLPNRCLNTLLSVLGEDEIYDAINISMHPSGDILKWIWTNRAKTGKKSIEFLTMQNVSYAMSLQDLQSAWLPAQRELKKLLLNNEKFQDLLLENSVDLAEFILSLNLARNIFPDERQALLVKMSRRTDELKAYIENKAKEKEAEVVDLSSDDQSLITSVNSHEAKLKELENLLTVEIPANVEAIAHARSYGDLKENSEYKAAKENQAFLSSRRGDIERELNNIQPIDFSIVKPDDIVIVGSSVSLIDEDDKESVIHIVGVWDGNPEKDLISYRTRLGESMLNRKVGASITLPNGKSAEIKGIDKLSDKILKLIG